MAQSGVTPETFRNMILDAAVVYVDYGLPSEFILGATNGGATFSFDEFEVRSPQIDGIKGRLAGASRITRASPKIAVSLVEWKKEAIELAFPGCSVVEAGGVATITRDTRLIPIEDYPTNLAMVGTQSGTGDPVVVMIKRPMVVTGAEIPTAENSEATATLEFVGHYDPDEPEDEPWEIRWPLGDGTIFRLRGLTIPAGATVEDDATVSTVVAAITGLSTGSTRSTNSPLFGITGSNLVVAASLSPGTYTFQIIETLGTAYNSPKASTVTVVVTAA